MGAGGLRLLLKPYWARVSSSSLSPLQYTLKALQMQIQTPAKLQAVDAVDPTKIEWYKGFRRPIVDILADLSKPIPPRYLASSPSISRLSYYTPVLQLRVTFLSLPLNYSFRLR